MTVFLLFALLIGYIIMAAVFLGAAWGANRRAKWLGLAVLAASAPFFFWAGSFAEQFGAGQCYSNAVGMIANAVERTDSPRQLAQDLRALPMHGYETSCSEVETATSRLKNSVAP
jgi:hypothetical protein